MLLLVLILGYWQELLYKIGLACTSFEASDVDSVKDRSTVW